MGHTLGKYTTIRIQESTSSSNCNQYEYTDTQKQTRCSWYVQRVSKYTVIWERAPGKSCSRLDQPGRTESLTSIRRLVHEDRQWRLVVFQNVLSFTFTNLRSQKNKTLLVYPNYNDKTNSKYPTLTPSIIINMY